MKKNHKKTNEPILRSCIAEGRTDEWTEERSYIQIKEIRTLLMRME